jgi:hypothetical protein
LDLRKTHAKLVKTHEGSAAKIAQMEEKQQAQAKKEKDNAARTCGLENLGKVLEQLKRRLADTEDKLAQAELEKVMAELKVHQRPAAALSSSASQPADQSAEELAKIDLELATIELESARSELIAKDAEISELRAGIGRRDEQIAFLMQVHDASQDSEWVDPALVQLWTCAACTLENKPHRRKCKACGTPRP